MTTIQRYLYKKKVNGLFQIRKQEKRGKAKWTSCHRSESKGYFRKNGTTVG